MRKILTAIMVCHVLMAAAYDFSAMTAGTTIYYNITSTSTVEVTFDDASPLYNCYGGEVSVPVKVSHGDVAYQVTAIGDKAFAYCMELTAVNLPASVVSIGNRSFLGCGAMREITLPPMLESIGENAFAWCDRIEQVSLPQPVERVAPSAFEGCLSLRAINAAAGSSVYTTEDGVLLNAAGDTILIYPAGKTDACALPLTVTAIGNQAFYGCDRLSEVKFSENVTSIGDGAFYFCNEIERIEVPASVTDIGSSTFADCYSLSEIIVSGNNKNYSSHNGMLLTRDRKRLLQSPAGRLSHDALPSEVREIADMAFFRNYGVKHISVPAGVTTIGMGAFLDCANAVSVHLPSTIREIGDFAFAMCGSIEHVYIDIMDPACLSLGEELFVNVPLESCTLYVPRDAVPNYQGYEPWNRFAIIEGYDNLCEQQILWDQELKPDCGEAARLHAKSTSGLPVNYAVASTSKAYAHIYADRITFTDPGDLLVTAYQQGSHEYAPATPVTRLIHVNGDSGIDDVLSDEARVAVYGASRRIVVKHAPEGAMVRVYGIGGEQVYSGYDTTVPVAGQRAYIVRVGHRAFKVLVK